MRVTILASGSKGNSLIIDTGTTRIAVDAGFGSRILAKRLRASGIAPESISACVVTHEHLDHAKGALAARKRWRWTVAATAQTLDAIGVREPASLIVPVICREPVTFGDARVTLFSISHDAVAPAAVLVEDMRSGSRVGIAYDLGIVPDSLVQAFSDLDVLVLEANHDIGMLRAGPYPLHLQERIAGPRGHLSNLQAASFAERVAHKGMCALVLAHLSEQNNTPHAARETVGRRLKRTTFRGKFGAASQNSPSTVGETGETQLQLF
jgi:phosphoribosyl 1,2-cyclic phosphodiesterase